MIEATSCGGVVIFRGKVMVLYKNYRNKYEGWVLPKGTVEEGEEFKEPKLVCDKCGNEDQSQYTEMVKIVKGDKKHFSLLVDEKPITSQMFNELREIIMYQNSADYQNDSWMLKQTMKSVWLLSRRRMPVLRLRWSEK